ncbi:hypothetical protein K438DRAFT_1764845 [Mycena galopus ATCC 62051]|nr:hypothetical protein K438DRAFT_1764845 [Mycena galopus ATCC 62051]
MYGLEATCTLYSFLAPSATERHNRGYEKRPQRSQADMPRLFYICENAFERPPRTPVSLEEWSPAAERMGRDDRLRSRSLRLPPVPTRMRIAINISASAKEKLEEAQAGPSRGGEDPGA